MCELFGLSSRSVYTANGYLRTFFDRSSLHPHGWGLACVSQTGVVIRKEGRKASGSPCLKKLLSQPIRSRILLGHIRYATIGHVAYENAHPFTARDVVGRQWTLIHNGTIFDYAPLNGYLPKQRGDTDSERILLYLIDKLNEAQVKKGAGLTFEERFALLDGILVDMSQGNKLNLLFSDGKYLYVHTNCQGTLYTLCRGGTRLFATVPLDEEVWQPVPFTRLLAYDAGKLVKTGTDHRHEYFENEESMRFLYQIFAGL